MARRIPRGVKGLFVRAGMGLRNGISTMQKNAAYKNSPEYKQKIIQDLDYEDKILNKKMSIEKKRAAIRKSQNASQNSGSIWDASNGLPF